MCDSLFSFEFNASKLMINAGVQCRFPTIAFKLLDFPTVSINLLDDTQRERLRRKLTVDPEYEVSIHSTIRSCVIISGQNCLLLL